MKKQILLCLLISTIIFTGCKEDTPTPTPTDIRTAFVGKWIGTVSYIIIDKPMQGLDTIVLALNPNNSKQLINTFNNNNTIYTVIDSKNYTLQDETRTDTSSGVPIRITIANSKGVLSTPTTIGETGETHVSFLGRVYNPTIYTITYTKQ